jgi:hypothetical protein
MTPDCVVESPTCVSWLLRSTVNKFPLPDFGGDGAPPTTIGVASLLFDPHDANAQPVQTAANPNPNFAKNSALSISSFI